MVLLLGVGRQRRRRCYRRRIDGRRRRGAFDRRSDWRWRLLLVLLVAAFLRLLERGLALGTGALLARLGVALGGLLVGGFLLRLLAALALDDRSEPGRAAILVDRR